MGTFIDEQGVTWDSVREHDLAITAGRYGDAMIEWKRTSGGKLIREDEDGSVTILFPNPWRIAREVCVDPANVNDAADEAVKARLFDERLRRLFQ